MWKLPGLGAYFLGPGVSDRRIGGRAGAEEPKPKGPGVLMERTVYQRAGAFLSAAAPSPERELPLDDIDTAF
jgi:hypothetical protein